MATELKEMEIKQVHLVGSPAIRKQYLIVKSEDGLMAMKKDQQDGDGNDNEPDVDADDSAGNSDSSGKKSKASKSDGSGANVDELNTALKARDAALIKSAIEILKSVESDEAAAALQALSGVETKPVEKSTKTSVEEVNAIIKSAMPEVLKSEVEPIQKALAETRTELEEVRKTNALLIGEKVEREIEEIVKNLSGDRETNLAYIRLMKSKLNDEEFAEVVKREQEKAETIRKSVLLQERGSNYTPTGSGDSPYQQLTDLANSIIQKSGDMQFSDAFSKACAERPDLWQDYRRSSYDNRARED